MTSSLNFLLDIQTIVCYAGCNGYPMLCYTGRECV